MLQDLDQHLIFRPGVRRRRLAPDTTHLELTPAHGGLTLRVHQLRRSVQVTEHPADIYLLLPDLLAELRAASLRDDARFGPHFTPHFEYGLLPPGDLDRLHRLAGAEFSLIQEEASPGVSLRVESSLDSRETTLLTLKTPTRTYFTSTEAPLALLRRVIEGLRP